MLRRRIDEMSNEEYQGLMRRPGAEARERLIGGAARDDRDKLVRIMGDTDDAELPALLADLGGHDVDGIVRALDAADAERDRPSVIFAYTIKGWRLPFAGDALNHSALMTSEQMAALAEKLGVEWRRPVGRASRPTRQKAGCWRSEASCCGGRAGRLAQRSASASTARAATSAAGRGVGA